LLTHLLYLLTYLFIGLAIIQLALIDQLLQLNTIYPLAVLILCGTGTAFVLPRYRYKPDPILLPLIFLLSGLGIVLTARLAPNFLDRQIIWLILSTFLLILINVIPTNLNWLRHYKYGWFFGGLTLLATTLIFGVNPSGYGARLWLSIGGLFYFQPSEPLKLLLVVFLAAYMADRHRQLAKARAYIGRMRFPHPSYWGPMLFMWGLSVILLVWQRDLGAALLFFGTFLGMVYMATGQSRYIWAGIGLLFSVGLLGYYAFDVVQLRVEAYLNPWLDASGRSFQIVQSLLAFASGGIMGQGLGQGLPTAIPVVHTDFVFAAIGEEYGLVGALAIVFCFILLISRAFLIGLQAENRFQQLLAGGIGTMMALQTLVIMAGTLKLMPLTGVTLPFVSYGGSSLLTSFAMVGLLLFMSSSHNRPQQRTNAPFAPYQLRLSSALLTMFLVVAGGLALWQVALKPFLDERPDNPRPVVTAQTVQRGSIFARDGTLLVETSLNEVGLAQRFYHYPELAPVTGYYSFRYGVSGAEAKYDEPLRGTENRTPEQIALDEMLHRQIYGQPITLTIDLPTQLTAISALGEMEGAVVMLDINTGDVIAMASYPTYDPNQLNELWDSLRDDEQAPLLNRTTQGLFPVGDLSRLIGLIGVYDSGVSRPTNPITTSLTELFAPLGETGYAGTAHQLQLTKRLRHFNSQTARLPDFSNKGTVRDLAVTPLHLARVMAALEQDGHLPEPRLSDLTTASSQSAFKPETAQFVRATLPQITPQLIGLAGLATPEETGRPEYLSWFVGLAPTISTINELSTPQSTPELIFDPSLITPTPVPAFTTTLPETAQAQYAIVVVIVTPQINQSLAQSVAEMVIDTLLE